MAWSVYILTCCDGTLYTGIALDTQKRFALHVSGCGARYTKIHPPLRIEYTLDGFTHREALRIEAQIKKLPKHKKVASLKNYTLDRKG